MVVKRGLTNLVRPGTNGHSTRVKQVKKTNKQCWLAAAATSSSNFYPYPSPRKKEMGKRECKIIKSVRWPPPLTC